MPFAFQGLHVGRGYGSVSLEIDKNVLMYTMADKLVLLRTNLDMKQAELAAKVGISRQTLSEYENKKRSMSWNVFLALLTVFREDNSTNNLLHHFGIYTAELSRYLTSSEHCKAE